MASEGWRAMPLPMQESIRRVGCRPPSREPRSPQLSAPPEISTARMLLALLVGALALSMATGRLIFKYSAARQPRRGDILDQRVSAWKRTELSPTFSPSDVSTRQANLVCDLPAQRELSCAPEELRQLLVRLVEHGTFSRWPPNVDPKLSCSPGGVSGALGRNQRKQVWHRHIRQKASQ